MRSLQLRHDAIRSCSFLLGILLALSMSVLARATTEGEELKDQVAQMVRQLDSDKAAEREAAQQQLIQLGPDVLPHLPKPNGSDLSAEQRRRLEEIQNELTKQAGQAELRPSRVTLSGKNITLSDAVGEIQRQTGNPIVDLREDYGEPVTDPELELDWKETPFWQAMDELTRKAGVGYDLFTGERYIGLRGQPRGETPVAYAGPLRIGVIQMINRITYENNENQCAMEVEVAWEPRLRPILLEQKPEDLEAVDGQGRPIEPETPMMEEGMEGESSMMVPVDSSMHRTQLIFNFERPERGAEKIARLAGKVGLVVPAHLQTFEFPDLKEANAVTQKSQNVSVTLERFLELEDALWQAEVVLQLESGGEALESYETWFYDNEAYLQKSDGTRFPVNGGITLTQTADGKIGIEYRFRDAPGRLSDYQFVYKTPSTVVRDAVAFEFKDLPLP